MLSHGPASHLQDGSADQNSSSVLEASGGKERIRRGRNLRNGKQQLLVGRGLLASCFQFLYYIFYFFEDDSCSLFEPKARKNISSTKSETSYSDTMAIDFITNDFR